METGDTLALLVLITSWTISISDYRISGFLHGVLEIFILPGCYAVWLVTDVSILRTGPTCKGKHVQDDTSTLRYRFPKCQ